MVMELDDRQALKKTKKMVRNLLEFTFVRNWLELVIRHLVSNRDLISWRIIERNLCTCTNEHRYNLRVAVFRG